MKRFSAISVLLVLTLSAMACAWDETHNYYLFHVCGEDGYYKNIEQTYDYWKKYIGSTDEYYYFSAEDIIDVAKKKGDTQVVDYVTNLRRYLSICDDVRQEAWQWEYPTKEQLAERNASLQQLYAYAKSHLTGKLGSQHLLLLMRCNMLLGKHTENVRVWEQDASKQPQSAYKEMMRNIYAGALLKTGRSIESGRIFAEQRDWQSLMTQYYKKRSFAAIQQEYMRDPKSAVLPFLLEDFVNNAQETYDGGGGWGKLFVRDIQVSEALQMLRLAKQAATEGKTQHPALWMGAKAWLEYMFGNQQQALADAKVAAAMDDSQEMKDNARVLLFYITAMQTKNVNKEFDDYVASEMEWLMKDIGIDDVMCSNYADRVVHQALAPKYAEAGRPITALALMGSIHASAYPNMLDTMKVELLQEYTDYVKSKPKTPLDRYLLVRQRVDDNEMNDLIGTKYLRLCQWEKALPWLQKVPLSYYEEKGYAVYAVKRKYSVEPWVKRQWIKMDDLWSDQKWTLTSNPKIDYANEMIALEKTLGKLKGKNRQQQCYDLATRYVQASYKGDCWFITHNGKSLYDTLHVNETDMVAKAVTLLNEAAQTSDLILKEKVLLALAWQPLNPDNWLKERWNNMLNEYEYVPVPQTVQFNAWANLARFENEHPNMNNSYVTRCDEYQYFKKLFNR